MLQGCLGAAFAHSGAQPSVLGCTYLVYRSGVPLRWDGRPSVPGCQISLACVPWCKASPGKGWVCPPGSLCVAFHPPIPDGVSLLPHVCCGELRGGKRQPVVRGYLCFLKLWNRFIVKGKNLAVEGSVMRTKCFAVS